MLTKLPAVSLLLCDHKADMYCVQALIENDPNGSVVKCVFWDFDDT